MNIYQEVFELHANLLKALAHPKRLEIIHLLRDRSLSVGEIQEMLDLPQANLSQHLQVLRNAKVVTTKKVGKQIHYRLSHKNFIKASDLLRCVLLEKYKNAKLAANLNIHMADLLPSQKDPVCGMYLSPKTAAFAHSHAGNHYYFCASKCFSKFKNDPKKYTIIKGGNR